MHCNQASVFVNNKFIITIWVIIKHIITLGKETLISNSANLHIKTGLLLIQTLFLSVRKRGCKLLNICLGVSISKCTFSFVAH